MSMISAEDLIRWVNDNATKGGYIKARDLNEIAESVDLCANVYHYMSEEVDGEPMRESRYIIEVNGTIPDRCYECAACSCESGYCQADPTNRTSDWRPFWCPAHEA